jgi:hypothetical protein
MNATAGDAYHIGGVRLGGFNGIPAFPILNLPGDPSVTAFGTPFYYVVCAALLLCYLLSRWILGSFFGKVLIGIRENEARVELLGYSAPLYKTAIFTISAGMAGLAGCLFANWAEIVTPGVFSLGQSAEVIIWTIVGGLGTLGAELTLVAARDFLHDADLAHRHEVVREREPFRGVDRQVVDAHDKLRIGQPPSTGSHRLRAFECRHGSVHLW